MAAVESEQAVLGAVLAKAERYWDCAQAGLRARHFSCDLHAQLWQGIEGALHSGLPLTPTALAQRLGVRAELEALGGTAWLVRLATGAAGMMAPARDHALLVIDWARRRDMVALAQALLNEAQDPALPTKEVLEAAEAGLLALRGQDEARGPVTLAAATEAALAAAERAFERGAVPGVASGLAAIDRSLGGLADSDLIVLAGRPGMGKSALAATIAQHVARDSQVALFSLEMSALQVASRLVAAQAQLDLARLRRGEITAAELRQAMARGQALKPLHLAIDETPLIRPAQMRARLKLLARRAPVRLVVVDYLQLMQGDGRYGREASRVLEVAEITAALKALAREFEAPVLALSQLSRAVEGREDKRPLLADLRDSGAIEQDADQVWFLYRDEYYARREEPPSDAAGERVQRWQARLREGAGQAELIVAKNRHGPEAVLKLRFEARLARFGDVG